MFREYDWPCLAMAAALLGKGKVGGRSPACFPHTRIGQKLQATSFGWDGTSGAGPAALLRVVGPVVRPPVLFLGGFFFSSGRYPRQLGPHGGLMP